MANVHEPDFEPPQGLPAPFDCRGATIGEQAGARELGASLYELRTGQSTAPFHIHHANEEMIIVLAGRPTLRTLEGERELEPGEVVACLPGPDGAHRVDNHGDETARVLIVSTMRFPEIVEYPDSDKILARTAGRGQPNELALLLRRDATVDYFDGEL